jgi:hypothetical protein
MRLSQIGLGALNSPGDFELSQRMVCYSIGDGKRVVGPSDTLIISLPVSDKKTKEFRYPELKPADVAALVRSFCTKPDAFAGGLQTYIHG